MSKIKEKQIALEMKLSGSSLNEIANSTGLSRPTIIKTYKDYLINHEKEVFPGRPKLESVLLNPSCAQALINSEKIFSATELHQFLQVHHQKPITQRSFLLLLKKIKWNEKIIDERNQCQIKSTQNKSLDIYILHAQINKEHLWSFHQSAPSDSHYSEMCKKIMVLKPELSEIQTDIYDLSYCKQVLELRKLINIHSDSKKIKNLKQKPELQREKSRANKLSIHNQLTHLEKLEAESIYIMREVIAEANNPVMLYSIGKDSAVMLHLALKAFYPSKLPFPLLHVDTLWKFQDMYRFRDEMVKQHGFKLLTHINPSGITKNINPFIHGSQLHTDMMKTEALKQALDQHEFDVAFGGARRDEEKSRAKDRIFSFRDKEHRWDPKNQRPELWNLYNTRKKAGETIRVFPLSNWTELDIWQYIYLEQIPIVPLYFAKERPVVNRNGALIMVDDERMPLKPGEIPQMKKVRFRTLGCYPLTGAIESEAESLAEIIQEMLLTNSSERQGRIIDHDTNSSMEKKKQEGYF